MSLSSRAHFSSALFVIFVWPSLLHSFSLTESFNFIFIYVKVAHGIWSFPEIFVFAPGYLSTFRTCVQVYLEWLPCLCWFLPSFHTLWLISCPFEVIIFLRYIYKAAFYTPKCGCVYSSDRTGPTDQDIRTTYTLNTLRIRINRVGPI